MKKNFGEMGILLNLHSLSADLFPGSFFSRLFASLWGSKELRILILGLDGAGKTTILYRLQVGEVVTTIPSEWALIRVNGHVLACSRDMHLGI